MLWFRTPADLSSAPATPGEIRQILDAAIRPEQFFVAPSLKLTWDHQDQETTHWELFRGQVLDHTRTRETRTFESWNIREGDGFGGQQEPLISIKLDLPARRIHVTRSIACRGFEAYTEANAILSRETTRRARELVGTIDLDRLTTCAEIQDELTALLFFTVVGASRLPLTSLEAPLPAFTLGQLAYCSGGGKNDPPIQSPEELLSTALRLKRSPLETSRALEAALRAESIDRIPNLAESFAAACFKNGCDLCGLPVLLREVFNNVALSPYTDFVAKALRFADQLLNEDDQADFLAHLLRQLGRHLTSFDLVKFHHRGANYPDALLLEEVLDRTAALLERSPRLFVAGDADDEVSAKRKRLRRRGLRSAWLIQRQYRGHRVPDAPTSPGENNRVLPDPFVRVPEEQILDPGKRTKQLFLSPRLLEHAAMRQALDQSVADLEHPAERLELGLGVSLDRPFGFAKAIGEPDRTTLFSHEAFSWKIARQRFELLGEIGDIRRIAWEHRPRGVSSSFLALRQRPGVASVLDAKMASNDFEFFKTTRRAVQELLGVYDFSALCDSSAFRFGNEPCVILPSPDSIDQLCIYDSNRRERLRLQMDASRGYVTRAGTEALAAGLTVVSARNETGDKISTASVVNLRNQI
jgi:hypothetical protein